MLNIDRDTARRFILGKQGLWPGRRWRGAKGAAEAMRALEYLQLDPLQIIARSQDIDSKLDRARGTLVLLGLWLEEEALGTDEAFAGALARGFARFTGFLGASALDASTVSEPLLRARLGA